MGGGAGQPWQQFVGSSAGDILIEEFGAAAGGAAGRGGFGLGGSGYEGQGGYEGGEWL